MGDRCFLQIGILDKDRQSFEDIAFGNLHPSWDPPWWYEEDLVDGVWILTLEEVNDGFYTELQACAEIPFKGFHGSGSSYSAREFVCDGMGEVHYLAVVNDLGRVMSINPSEREKEGVRTFLSAERLIEVYFKKG